MLLLATGGFRPLHATPPCARAGTGSSHTSAEAPAGGTTAARPAWERLPQTPALPARARTGFVAVGGARIFYAAIGEGRPAIFLHGGPANANYWGLQLAEIGANHQAIAIDLRGHARSSPATGALSYALFAADVVAVMDQLKLPKAAIVGWSDGAIAGLDLAMRHGARIEGLFAFAANFNREGLIKAGSRSRTFVEYGKRCAAEFAQLAPQPAEYGQLLERMHAVWTNEPNYRSSELAAITARTWVVDGEHDEIITGAHTRALAAAIPEATLVIEPAVSHFALLQDPGRFTRDVRTFLEATRES